MGDVTLDNAVLTIFTGANSKVLFLTYSMKCCLIFWLDRSKNIAVRTLYMNNRRRIQAVMNMKAVRCEWIMLSFYLMYVGDLHSVELWDFIRYWRICLVLGELVLLFRDERRIVSSVSTNKQFTQSSCSSKSQLHLEFLNYLTICTIHLGRKKKKVVEWSIHIEYHRNRGTYEYINW